MVLISNKKYACETCIKGHRSSSCNHTERQLYEIKRKGRPVTQCQHCRELRKSKQIHVKCICGLKGELSSPVEKVNGIGSSFYTTNGASTTIKIADGGSQPDGQGEPHSCSCDASGECHCYTTRKSPPKNKSKMSVALDSRSKTITEADYKKESRLKKILPKSTTPANIISRIAGLRPLFPRPSKRGEEPPESHFARPHLHDNGISSPYHRAYEHNREMSGDTQEDLFSSASLPDTMMWERPASQASMYTSSDAGSSSSYFQPMISSCGCGDGCTCPGCAEHNLSGSRPTLTGAEALASCSNPGACDACLDCGIYSLPDHVPLDTSLPELDGLHTQSIDDWIRQVPLLSQSVNTDCAEANQQIWDSILPADIIDTGTFLQPPIPGQCQICPPGNCQHGLSRVCGGDTFSNLDALFTESETSMSGPFGIGGGVDSDAESGSSYSSHYGDPLSLSTFDGSLHVYHSPSSASSSSQSSFYSALSGLGSLDGGWNSHSSVVGNISGFDGLQAPPHLDGFQSDANSSMSNFSSLSIHERFNGRF